MGLRVNDILCFGPSDWWGMNPSCTTHLMRKFSGTQRVVYVNPFSSDVLGSIGTAGGRRGFWTRVMRKLKSLARLYRKVSPTLYVVSPFFLPFQGVGWVDRLNDAMIKIQLSIVCRCLRVRHPILWVENLRAESVLDGFASDCIVYQMSDLFTDDSYVAHQSGLAERENRILNRADLVICVSHSLYERLDNRHSNRFYLPHGVDFDMFQEALRDNTPMEELNGLSHPIIGYFGTLTAHNDIELLTYCAQRMIHMSFVFAGQISGGDYTKLQSLPNVRFVGRLPYEKIPVLCARLDVGLMPWKMDSWIRNCNPLKMFEYMACGKPIVSVPILEAQRYGDLIEVCETKEAFCDALESVLRHDDPERRQARMKVAQHHSWQAHLETIRGQLDDVLTRKSGGSPSHA
jgi:glycosyltransferase involved in cell wall biosynthesis